MMNIFENSLFLKYWEYFLTLVFILFGYIFYMDKYSKGKNIKLDGAEYIGADYANESNDSALVEEYLPSLEEKEHITFSGATKTLKGGAEKFFEIVNNRRSVRSYSRKEIPFEVIEKCISAAGTAPSGAHTEPWTFCVISDMKIKEQIREIIEAEEYLNYNQRMHKQWTSDLRPLKTDYIKEYLTEAPYLILIFKQIYGTRIDGQKKQHYYNEISVSIATGILLCAFQAAGLSSLVTTPLNCGPALRLLLNRPQNEKLLVLLPVGYPADNCKIPNLQRKLIDEILVKY